MEKKIPYDIDLKHIVIPSSKSYAQRILLAASLADEPTKILRLNDANDVLAMQSVIQKMGAQMIQERDGITVIPGTFGDTEFNVGESGLGMRMLSAVLACIGGNYTIKGEGSLLERPLRTIQHFLPQLGISVKTNDGFAPVELSGKAKPGHYQLPETNSSQNVTGLLMGLPLLDGDSKISQKDAKSKPYLKVTEDVLNRFGIYFETDDYLDILIPGNQSYKSPGEIIVEADWSGAANWVVYGSIKSGTTIYGLNPDSVQGDMEILTALEIAGGRYQWRGDDLVIYPSAIQPFEFDANHCPDLFPPLVVLAAAAEGTSRISGTERLVNKESNRAAVLKVVFANLGLFIEFERDDMIIHGTGKLLGGEIFSHNDHRIAMAAAVAAPLTNSHILINGAEAVAKSYPEFWSHFLQS